MTTRWPILVLALCLTAPSSAAPRKADPDWPPPGIQLLDRIAAIVNTEPITQFELSRAMGPFVLKLREEHDGDELEAKLAELQREVLASLVNDILIHGEARKLKLEVTQEQIDQQLERVKRANGWSDDDLDTAIKQLGFESMADYRRHAERELLKNQAISIRVSSRIVIDEAEVQRVFKDKFENARGVEERRAAHVLLRVGEFAPQAQVLELEKKLRAIREQALTGEATFEELARRHSEDKNAQAGGDLGWFTRGDLDPEFESVAFELREDEISEIVRTSFGLHIIKITGNRYRMDIDEEKRAALLRQIRYRLRERELARLYRLWVDELRKTAFVEVKLDTDEKESSGGAK